MLFIGLTYDLVLLPRRTKFTIEMPPDVWPGVLGARVAKRVSFFNTGYRVLTVKNFNTGLSRVKKKKVDHGEDPHQWACC